MLFYPRVFGKLNMAQNIVKVSIIIISPLPLLFPLLVPLLPPLPLLMVFFSLQFQPPHNTVSYELTHDYFAINDDGQITLKRSLLGATTQEYEVNIDCIVLHYIVLYCIVLSIVLGSYLKRDNCGEL